MLCLKWHVLVQCLIWRCRFNLIHKLNSFLSFHWLQEMNRSSDAVNNFTFCISPFSCCVPTRLLTLSPVETPPPQRTSTRLQNKSTSRAGFKIKAEILSLCAENFTFDLWEGLQAVRYNTSGYFMFLVDFLAQSFYCSVPLTLYSEGQHRWR